jgi:dephospho-CoA kinase
MLKIGLTGGIGSGKSTVARVIEAIGYPVFYSDLAAKKILENNNKVKIELIKHFGEGVCRENVIDRKILGQLVFSNQKNLGIINGIVHPEVRNQFIQWTESQKMKLVFNEAAILFETGNYLQFDKNILVIAPESTRIERVMKRDNLSKDEVLKRILQQWKDDEKIPLADYIISNDNRQPLLIQIEKIIEDLKMNENHFS